MRRTGLGTSALIAMATFGCSSPEPLAGPACNAAIVDPPPRVTPMPRYESPPPTGALRVGTRILHMIDAARPEIATDDPSDHREVVVQLYYPTDATGPMAPLMTAEEAAVFAEAGWPSVHLDVSTHSTFDVPLSASRQRYPLVIYSHGLGTSRHDNRSLLESLASHGLVVAAISHSYYDGGSTLTSGVVANFEGNDRTTRLDRNQIWSDDIRFVIEQLDHLANGADCALLANRLDLSSIGMFGFSTGGAAALRACSAEPRCRAVAALDWIWGALGAPQRAPVLYLGGLWTSLRSARGWDLVAERAVDDAYSAWIDGLGHHGFSSAIAAADALGAFSFGRCNQPDFDCGPIDRDVAYADYSSYVESFFRAELLGEPNTLSTQPEGMQVDHPEVVFERTLGGTSDAPPSVFGIAKDVVTGTHLTDVVVASTRGTAVPTTANGRWMVTGLSPADPVTVRFERDGYWPSLTTLVPGQRSVALGTPMVPTGAEAFIFPPGVTRVSGRGVVVVTAFQYSSDAFEGVVLASSAASPIYLRDGVADPTLHATAFDAATLGGTALFANVAPGTMTLTFSHPTYHCAAARTPSSAPGSVDVVVEPDVMTFVQLVCEP